MKRLVYTIVVMILLGGIPLSAQDTIDRPPDNYFCNFWPGDSIDFSTEQISLNSIITIPQSPDTNVLTKRYTTDNALTIYGIAVGLVSMGISSPWLYEQMMDTSLYNDSCYEYVDIYYREGLHSMQRVARAKVKYEPTPVHYVKINSLTRFDKGPHPIFEAYFEKPIEVHDTFYAGVTQHLSVPYLATPSEYRYITWPLCLLILNDDIGNCSNLIECDTYAWRLEGRWFFTQHDYPDLITYCPPNFGFIFPITTPPPDPSPNPPAGIDDAEVNGIHLATRDGRIAVQGLTPGRQAEVFDMMGRRQAALATDGLTPPLPQGVYVVRAGHNWSRKVVLIK